MKEDATTLKENMEGYMEVFVGGDREGENNIIVL